MLPIRGVNRKRAPSAVRHRPRVRSGRAAWELEVAVAAALLYPTATATAAGTTATIATATATAATATAATASAAAGLTCRRASDELSSPPAPHCTGPARCVVPSRRPVSTSRLAAPPTP